MKFVLASLAALASATILDEAEYRFMEFISKHDKNYDSADEYTFRLMLWKELDQVIESHNADVTQTHKLGHNNLSDKSQLEKAALLGLKKNSKVVKSHKYFTTVHDNADSVDWRDEGAVTDVKD